MRLRNWLRCTALALGLAACASDARVFRPLGTPSGSTTGSGGSIASDAGAPSKLGADNPNGLLQTPDASMPTIAMTPAGVMMPTSISTPSRTPISIDQTTAGNPAGLATADVAKLMAGGPLGTMKWLYPYDGTVFPRGMLAPLVMWDGPAADVVYLHIKSQAFEYKGVLNVTPQGGAMPAGLQLQVPQDIWDKAGQQTNGKADSFSVELSARSNGSVSGPIMSHFTIAQATVKGSIYYNSYASQLAGTVGGSVLRIPQGGKAELFLFGQCNGCHSVSANGSRMVSQTQATGQDAYGVSYELVSAGAPNPMATKVGPQASFGALYPDGSKFLATSAAIPLAHVTGFEGANGPTDATLYDTTTGHVVHNTAVPPGALMPTLSPDGKRLVFNDYAINKAHGLATMDYDTQTDKASNYKLLQQEPDGTTRPAWPFFLPDTKAVIFVRTDGNDLSGSGAGVPGFIAFPIPISDLYIADVATGMVTILAKAMGFDSPADAANDKTYLPFAADDLHHSYFPTVSAVAAGGYFWVFFDAIRHYGNMGAPRGLWGLALDIAPDGNYQRDPSHPAFYLPGQEFGTGNHRAFAALDPCEKDGDSCTSGIDCCGGFCYLAAGSVSDPNAVGTCSPEMTMCAKSDCTTAMCANRDERCTTTADCCPPKSGELGNVCIAGFCAFISPD